MSWLPIISQAKSIVHLVTGNPEKAKEVQVDFSKQCPIVSQMRSLVEYASGDSHAAKETQKEFLGVVDNTLNSIPVIGHVKSFIHYAYGDEGKGDDAMKDACRSTGRIVGGVAGMTVAGPIGAIAGGIAGAASVDSLVTTFDEHSYGYLHHIENIIDDDDRAGNAFDLVTSVVYDGLVGFSVGKLARFGGSSKTSNKVGGNTKASLKSKALSKAKTSKAVSKTARAVSKPSTANATTGATAPSANGTAVGILADAAQNAAVVGLEVATSTILQTQTGLRSTEGIEIGNATEEVVHPIEEIEDSYMPKPSKISKVTDIRQLERGDHIMYERPLPYTHHAIVTDVYPETNEYKVIHFISAQNNGSGKGKAVIMEEVKQLDAEFPLKMEYTNLKGEKHNIAERAEAVLETMCTKEIPSDQQ